MSKVRKPWRLRSLLWLLILPALWYVLRGIPFEEIWAAIGNLAPWKLLLLLGLNSIILLLFTSRWWLVLRALGYRLPLISLVGYRLAAFGISYFTPGPQFGGEPIQIQLTRQKHQIPSAAAFAGVSLDKLFELLSNFSFILIGIVVVLRSQVFTNALPLPLLAATVILFSIPAVYLLGIWVGRSPVTWLAKKLPHRFSIHPLGAKAVGILAASEDQLLYFFRQKPGVLIQVAAISTLSWLLVVAEYWLTVYFLGETLTTSQVIILLTAARIAFLLPSPGGLGTLEASQVLVMGAFGLSPGLAISASLLIRGRDLALGGFGLWLGAVLSQRRTASSLPSQAGD